MQAVSFLILCAYACDSCANIKGIFNRTHTLPWGRGKLVCGVKLSKILNLSADKLLF